MWTFLPLMGEMSISPTDVLGRAVYQKCNDEFSSLPLGDMISSPTGRHDQLSHEWERWSSHPKISLGSMIISPNRGRDDHVSQWETSSYLPLGDLINPPTIGRDDHPPQRFSGEEDPSSQRERWSLLPCVGSMIISPLGGGGEASHKSNDELDTHNMSWSAIEQFLRRFEVSSIKSQKVIFYEQIPIVFALKVLQNL